MVGLLIIVVGMSVDRRLKNLVRIAVVFIDIPGCDGGLSLVAQYCN